MDYISRENYCEENCGKENREGYKTCKNCGMLNIPSADVQPVKHGRWIITDDAEHFIAACSECGRTEDSRAIKDMPYCHCGARMDGEKK